MKNSDMEQLYTLRWILRERWGRPNYKSEAIDLTSRLLGEVIGEAEIVSSTEGDSGAEFFGDNPDDILESLSNRKIALWVGHEPGGGATGERTWNIGLSRMMHDIANEYGTDCRVFYHKIKAYGKRQDEMRARMLAEFPDAEIALELHYDAVKRAGASGYHFQYVSDAGKEVATEIRDSFSETFPNQRRHRDDGLLLNRRGNGAGFMLKAPPPAVLCEPFFRSNPEEWEFFRDRTREVAMAYLRGIAKYFEANPLF